MPGDGTIPLREYVVACRSRGYDGPISVEVADPRLCLLSRIERTRRAQAAVMTVA